MTCVVGARTTTMQTSQQITQTLRHRLLASYLLLYVHARYTVVRTMPDREYVLRTYVQMDRTRHATPPIDRALYYARRPSMRKNPARPGRQGRPGSTESCMDPGQPLPSPPRARLPMHACTAICVRPTGLACLASLFGGSAPGTRPAWMHALVYAKRPRMMGVESRTKFSY